MPVIYRIFKNLTRKFFPNEALPVSGEKWGSPSTIDNTVCIFYEINYIMTIMTAIHPQLQSF